MAQSLKFFVSAIIICIFAADLSVFPTDQSVHASTTFTGQKRIEGQNNMTLTDWDITGELIIINSSNITITGSSPGACKIHNDGSKAAISMYNVSHITIENCEIYNASNGIWIDTKWSGAYGSSDNITIRNNHIHDINDDGIQAKRYDGHFDKDITDLEIIDNQFASWGKAHAGGYLWHGIYMKATDSLIEGNTFTGGIGGDAISIRTSGIVRGNTINDSNATGGIGYWAQIPYGTGSETLVIENNIYYMNTPSGSPSGMGGVVLGGVGEDPAASSDYLIPKSIIRFNTLAVRNYGGSLYPAPLWIDVDMNTEHIDVYGNLFIDTRSTKKYVAGEGYIDYNKFNYKKASANDLDSNYRVLSSASYLINQVNRAELNSDYRYIPPYDIDGQSRPTGSNPDYGADEY